MFKSANNLISPLMGDDMLELREHNINEANDINVGSNKLMLLKRFEGDGTESPSAHPTAEPTKREQVNSSETLTRRVQSLAIYPISAVLIGDIVCHATLKRLLLIRSKETVRGGTRVCKLIHGDSRGASVTAATFNR